jgi:hypothetical protein
VCNGEKPPKQFDYKELRELAAKDKEYLIQCIDCKGKAEQCGKGEVQCNLCKTWKKRPDFSASRQRSATYGLWRCKACDFPPCEKCAALPEAPKKKPYVCLPCLYPPCACGAKRPQKVKYKSTKRELWKCVACAKKTRQGKTSRSRLRRAA